MAKLKRKPAVFRKAADREIKFSRAGSASEAIGRIEKRTDTFILTFGQFSLIDALVHILDQTGPASVDIATWTAADADLPRTAELLESTQISRFRLIVDTSFEARQPGYCAHMRKLFGTECVRALRTHAKFMVIRSATHDIVVRTSMNLNNNPRLENLEISEDPDFADYFECVVDSVFDEVRETETQYKLPNMDNIPDTSPFTSIHADQIPRRSLHEPSAIHTLRKL